MSKFTKAVSNFFEGIKQIKIDKTNRQLFLDDIKREIQDPRSRWNQLELSINEDYTKISCVISIPENYQLAGTDIMKYQKLQEYAQTINKYINNDLNWGQYFLMPEFYYIETSVDNMDDVEQDILEEVSCSYIASWTYAPLLNRYTTFKRDMGIFVGLNSCILIGLVALLIILI